MNCMKCGRETEPGNVFCEECLADMEKYPVKPDTAVQLPRRQDSGFPKKARGRRRAAPTPEEQVKRLKRRVRLLAFFLAVALILLTVFGALGVRYLRKDRGFLPGQNYSAVDSASQPAAE